MFKNLVRILAIGGALGIGAMPMIAQAQVGISPMVIELQESGGQAQAVINVVNNTDREFRARVYALPFTYTQDRGFEVTAENPNSLVPYLRFSPRELSVPAGVTRRVRLNVQLPANLPSGEYRTVIFTENLDRRQQTNQNGAITTITTRIGVTLFVRRGNGQPQIDLVTAQWHPAKQKIILTMHNAGAASAYPIATWKLTLAGQTLHSGQSSPTGIVPASSRTIDLTLPKLSAGTYRLSGDLAWGQGEQRISRPFSTDVVVP
jgi:P pilus assembly chaperone PapD